MYNNSYLNNLDNEYTKLIKVKRHQIINWINTMNFKYFVTLTFKNATYQRECEKYLKAIIKMVNKDYFNKKKNNNYLKGFLFIEKHASGIWHFHILFEDNYIFTKKPHKNFSIIFKKKAKSISKSTNKGYKYYPIDVDKGIDIQEYYEGGLLEYLTKNIEYNTCNFDFMTFLDRNGFMDYPDLKESFRF